MEFEKKDNSKKIGKIFGYVIIAFIFSLMLYLILSIKNPGFNYLYSITISLLVILTGLIIAGVLK